MELEIVDREAEMLHLALGITDERAKELANELDEIMNKILLWYDTTEKRVFVVILFQKVAAICNNIEEYTFCISNNINWLISNELYNLPGYRISADKLQPTKHEQITIHREQED